MVDIEFMNSPTVIYEEGKRTILNVGDLTSCNETSQGDVFANAKEYKKYVDKIERDVRGSYEYRLLIEYLKCAENMTTCAFLQNVSNIDHPEIKIEIHHSPFTLYDITDAVLRRRAHNKLPIGVWDVGLEIMWLHFMGFVGLVPVCKTVHELIHNRFLFVPTHIVRGFYKVFVKLYDGYINPETLDALDNVEIVTEDYLKNPTDPESPVNLQMQIFNIHPTYVQYTNVNPVNELPNAWILLKNRVTALSKNKKLMYRLVDTINKK